MTPHQWGVLALSLVTAAWLVFVFRLVVVELGKPDDAE